MEREEAVENGGLAVALGAAGREQSLQRGSRVFYSSVNCFLTAANGNGTGRMSNFI